MNTESSSWQTWRLLLGKRLVGEIHVNDSDFPWLRGRFVPGTEFEGLRDLFDAELALIEQGGELDVEKWESIYQQIAHIVTLVKPDGIPVAEFLLHIKGDKAWFRWSDEPFGSAAG